MVLEGLIQPFKAEKKPFELFFLGIIFSSVAIVLSIFIFSPHSSIVSISLTAMVCVPVIYGVIKIEERKSMEIQKEMLLVKEHGRALLFFLCLFLGFVVSFSLWYIFLPESYASEVFSVQTDTISGVWEDVTGNAVGPAKAATQLIVHNSKVMLFCLLFAFFYGFGAIFILAWNASVIGVAIGDVVRSSIGVSIVSSISAGLFRYLVHGIPEIAAYFTAGLAGGIISIAVINHDIKSAHFKNIVKDSADLIALSFVFLVVAALLEVFVSPLV
ncbi:stage II sporulation protein M [Candidatus Woesearchaeota archaeon]|nr:stage II sporulation protein M [Candidatus Woesearchaeota archaeon]